MTVHKFPGLESADREFNGPRAFKRFHLITRFVRGAGQRAFNANFMRR